MDEEEILQRASMVTISQKESKVTISREVKNDMNFITARAFPREACAVVLGSLETSANKSANADSLLAIGNSTNIGDGRDYFEINPLDLYKAEQMAEAQGKEIIGVFHSHPDTPAVLSREDENHMIPGMLYLIASVTKSGIADIRGYVRHTPDGKVYEPDIYEE